MKVNSKIFIAGHHGLVGSAIHRRLQREGFENFVLRAHSELDLRDQDAVQSFFLTERPEYVFLAAAKVGGIHANNKYRADFIHDNLMIQTNVIHASFTYNVTKLLFMGSSCIYPKYASQPIKEDSLLASALEPTNEPYAIAKIAGIKMCQAYHDQYGSNFISVMPTNLYGPNDNYHPMNSHVVPALIQKFYEAKFNRREIVEIWGSGNPRREFLHVDDFADACLFLMEEYNSNEIINVGSGFDVSIRELALLLKDYSGFEGELYFNKEYPDGTQRKLLDNTKLSRLGWVPKISLKKGIKEAYEEFERKAGLLIPVQ